MLDCRRCLASESSELGRGHLITTNAPVRQVNPPMGKDTSPNYWGEFTNLQFVKHQLIREYLNGWFPKLGIWSRRVVYLDTHAGRGRHNRGQSDSPVVVIETLLKQKYRDRILKESEARFVLREHDRDNVDSLREAVAELGRLPPRIHVDISANDCFEKLSDILEILDRDKQPIAPAFVFIDPYGFKVPAETLSRLLAAGRVELFVNVVWRAVGYGDGAGDRCGSRRTGIDAEQRVRR